MATAAVIATPRLLIIVLLILASVAAQGASSNTASKSVVTKAAAATPTVTTAASSSTSTSDCDKAIGICQPPGLDTQCINLEKTQRCLGFVGYYIPSNIQDYISNRFPLYKPKVVPQLSNASMFDMLFGTYSFSYFSKYKAQYSYDQIGCTSPDQRWYSTWMCIDILSFYRDKQEPCTLIQSTNPSICQSTLQERANSLRTDLNNFTVCNITPKDHKRGMNYADSLEQHPWAKGGSSICIAGTDNEASNPTCGYTENLACRLKNCTMPDFDSLIRSQCDAILKSDAEAASSAASSSTPDPNLRIKTTVPIAIVTFAIFIGLVLVAALGALSRNRTRSEREIKAAEKKSTRKGKDLDSAGDISASQQNEPIPLHVQYANNMMSESASNLYSNSVYGSQVHLLAPTVGFSDQQNPPFVQSFLSNSVSTPASLPVSPSAVGGPAVANQQPVIVSYTAEQHDEVTMNIGDQASIEQNFGDGWGSGTNHTTGMQGVFPLTCFGDSYAVKSPSSGNSGDNDVHNNTTGVSIFKRTFSLERPQGR